MDKEEICQLKEKAFTWFKLEFNTDPQSAGFAAAVVRKKRMFFFLEVPQVVFAPEEEIANSFIKMQRRTELMYDSMALLLPLAAIPIIMALILLGYDESLKALLMLLGAVLVYVSLAVVAFVYAKKARQAEGLYEGKIVVYTEQ